MNISLKKIFALCAILLFALPLTICEAQDWISAGSPDTIYIMITVNMIGAGWTCNEGGDGALHSVPPLSFSLTADTLSAELDSATAPVNPCDVIHHIFWIENTGGITLDFNAFYDEMLSGPDWVHSDAETTSCRGEDTLVGSYSFEPPDPTLSTTPAVWTVLPESLGATDEYEDLYAEDPNALGDGIWEADENDIVDFHILYVMPGSSSSIRMQHFYSVLVAKLTD